MIGSKLWSAVEMRNYLLTLVLILVSGLGEITLDSDELREYYLKVLLQAAGDFELEIRSTYDESSLLP